jgi:ribosomal protein L16 Arg81 hydroxylase
VIHGLGDLVAPIDADEFRATVWGRRHRLVEGAAGRFAHLLPWDELNRILAHHRLEFPRLRLAMDGATVPVESYTDTERNRRGVAVPRLRAEALTERLRAGATLVLDAVDELSEPVGELAAALERDLREHVQVNAYVGWGTTHGFDLHWDDHDVFVLQVAGCKRWEIHGATRPWPLFRDTDAAAPPTTGPVAEHLVTDGDLLYLPRGWWHVAAAIGQPSLHLTFGVNPATGIDLLAWLADRLRTEAAFRRDLPRFAGADERRAHGAALRALLTAAWTDDLVEQFLADRDATARPRPRFGLPWSATAAVLPPDDDVQVRLVTPRALLERTPEGVVELRAAGRQWTFAAPAWPLLAALAGGEPRTIKELVTLPGMGLERDTARAFLAELATQGLLALV